MEIEQATIVAHNYLQSKIAPLCDGDTLVIVRDAIQEDKDGWFFPYQAQGYLETKSLNHSVVGNWPISFLGMVVSGFGGLVCLSSLMTDENTCR
jgi:hypothetical protein